MSWDTRIYLDHAASAPLTAGVREAMHAALDTQAGNPSSVHGAGQAARAHVDAARRAVARALHAKPREVVLTSGATEANVLALRGSLATALRAHQLGLGPQPHIAIFALEHPSLRLLAAALQLDGVRVETLPAQPDGRLALDALDGALQQGAKLVVVQAVNQELGVIQPLAEIGVGCRQVGAQWHCDATQALGKLELDVQTLGCTSLALSGHKIGAPSGVGALWLAQPDRWEALQPGHQEGGKRAGTENVLGCVGLQAALHGLPARLAALPQTRALRDRLWNELRSLPGVLRNGPQEPDLETGTVLSLSFPWLNGAELVLALDVEGIAVSAGSACASGTQEPSQVLRALGDGGPESLARARGALRLSLGPETTETDVETAARWIRHHAEVLRAEGYGRFA